MENRGRNKQKTFRCEVWHAQREAGLSKSLIDSGRYISLIGMEIFLTGKERPWERGVVVSNERRDNWGRISMFFSMRDLYTASLLFYLQVRYAYINMDYKWKYLSACLQENNYQAEPQLSPEYYLCFLTLWQILFSFICQWPISAFRLTLSLFC